MRSVQAGRLGEVFKGKVVSDYDEFFKYGIGAMQWSRDNEGRRVLWFLAPDITGRAKFEVARIYTETDGEFWNNPGTVEGWDGNEERPTFDPSIWLLDKKGWHGFIRNGDLVTA